MARGKKSRASLASLWRDRSANIAVTSALCLPLSFALAAFAIDEGGLYGERRALQQLADLAAITAAANPAKAEQAVLTTLSDNGVPAVLDSGAGKPVDPARIAAADPTARVIPGHYSSDPGLAPANRFVPGGKPVNAFRITLTRPGTRYFAAGLIPTPTMRTVATGHASAEAAFSIGSRLVSLDGGVANAVLGSLVGTKLGLSAMDYRALADARIETLPLLDRTATRANIKAATYADLLDADVPVSALFGAMSAAPGLDGGAAAALRALATAAPARLTLKLESLFDLGTFAYLPLGNRSGGAAATARALGLVSAAAAAANGARQVEIALGAALPGIMDASLSLAIGEPMQASPWLVAGEESAKVRTAQTRLLLRVRVEGPGGALGPTVTLPVYAELAFAEGQLAEVRCTRGRDVPDRVSIKARPGIAALRIADISVEALADFRRSPVLQPATLISMPLVSVTGSAAVSIEDANPTELVFSTRDIDAQTVKTVAARDLLASVTASLLSSLSLDVRAAGFKTNLPPALSAALDRSLQAAAQPADKLLASVLAVLGISLGEADVTINGGACRRAVLVQ